MSEENKQMPKEENKLLPELQDIMQRIYAYNTVHKDGCFLFRFVGYKKSDTEKCIDCGEPVDEYDPDKSEIGAYGDLETLRKMLNEMRDLVEDYADEDGFVIF